MKKIILFSILLLLIPNIVYSGAPSRPHTYRTRDIVDPDENNANENTLYNYLSAGVDTFEAGSVNAAAIGSNAVGNSEIINTDDFTLSGTNTLSGTSIFSGTANVTGTINTTGIFQFDGATGTTGQIIRSAGAAATPTWATAPTTPATLIVAASDSVDTTRADYTCDGTADDVQIQQAIDDLDTAGVGGRVVLLEGTYVINATITMAAGDEDLVLQGQGLGTILEARVNLGAPVLTITADRITVKDLYVDAGTNAQATEYNWISVASADYFTIEGVKVYGGIEAVVNGTALININDGDYFRVLNNILILTAEGANERGILMLMGGSQLGIVKGNIINGSASAVNVTYGICGYAVTSGFTRCVISDNVIIGDGVDFDYGIILANHADFSDNVIADNQIYDCDVDSIAIVGANASNNVVDGNMARDGIADTGTATVVGDNVVA